MTLPDHPYRPMIEKICLMLPIPVPLALPVQRILRRGDRTQVAPTVVQAVEITMIHPVPVRTRTEKLMHPLTLAMREIPICVPRTGRGELSKPDVLADKRNIGSVNNRVLPLRQWYQRSAVRTDDRRMPIRSLAVSRQEPNGLTLYQSQRVPIARRNGRCLSTATHAQTGRIGTTLESHLTDLLLGLWGAVPRAATNSAGAFCVPSLYQTGGGYGLAH